MTMVVVPYLRSPRITNRVWRAILSVLISAVFGLGAIAVGAAQRQKLEKSYKDWLEHDVVYLITNEERDAFLKLTSDDARDKFIQQFWAIRNPNPGSPENTYKDEIYQRIAYANARFGGGSATDGWRTDRGRTYITLGPPQQKETYLSAANLYPIEIWFYSYSHPALPAFFYVMFYQRDGFGDMRYYSPFMDGPDKLVPGTETINNRKNSLKSIQDSVGDHVAHLALSLIPNEPIDPTAARPSLQSDAMLATIKSLANNPFTKQDLDRRRNLIGSVTARLVVPGQNLDVTTLPVRDSRGLTRLDYAIRFRKPSDFTVETRSDGRFSYILEARVTVLDSDNKPIFVQEKNVSEVIDKEQFESMKDKRVGYEGSLPLPPGKYHLNFRLTDWKKKIALEAQKEAVIPETNQAGVTISGILPFSAVEAVDPGKADTTPFTLAGMKFTPLGASPLLIGMDQPIQLAYQIWAPPADPHAYSGQKLEVEYAVGRPSAAGASTVTKEEVSKDQFDPSGSLVNGKKLSLEGQPPGNYMLTVSLGQAGTNQHAFSTLNFSVLADMPASGVWDLADPAPEKDVETGVVDRQRGLCLLAEGKADEARQWLRRALTRDHSDDIARSRLVDAYYAKKDYSAIISLYADVGITEQTDTDTVLRIADSFGNSGQAGNAVSALEAAVASRPEDAPLYLSLAEYYKQTGNAQKSVEAAKKGQSLLNRASATSKATNQ
jgi:GWxTD domain-containing protein